LASSSEAAVFLFLIERMRLSLSPHPQLSVIARTPSHCTTDHSDDFAGLFCRAHSAQALRLPPTPATKVQLEDHRNALDRKLLQKTPVLAMAQSQTCHRYRKCTKVASEPI
jgi:hypothetical protein